MNPSISQALSRIRLSEGMHPEPANEFCVMECVAYVMAEGHTDHPECACPVVTAVAIYANDERLKECGPALAQRVLRLAGSKGDDETRLRRTQHLVGFLFRDVVPSVLEERYRELSPVFAELAKECRSLGPLDTREAQEAAVDIACRMEVQCLPFAEDSKWAAKQLSQRQLRLAADSAVEAFHKANAGFDVIALLDYLLDIGNTQDVPVTPERERRLRELAALPKPKVPAALRR